MSKYNQIIICFHLKKDFEGTKFKCDKISLSFFFRKNCLIKIILEWIISNYCIVLQIFFFFSL